MARLGLDRLFAFVSHCHGALDRHGLYVEQIRYLADARKALAQIGAPPARSLDPDLSDFTEGDAFWLLLRQRAPAHPRTRSTAWSV